jgi:hypothetical protein
VKIFITRAFSIFSLIIFSAEIVHSGHQDITSNPNENLINKDGSEMQDRFQELDKYAIAVPAMYERDISSLATYLQTPAKNDLEKARLIYTWIATHIEYDDKNYNSRGESECNPEKLLNVKKTVCEGFSALYKALGDEIGIEIQTVHGFSKGYSYHKGQIFKETNHAWNVIKIEGEWRPFDVTWGEGFGITKDLKLKSVRRLSYYWFNTAPIEFIFTHFPEDSTYQIISRKVTKKEFEGMPWLSESFFRLGFNGDSVFSSYRNGTIKDFPEVFDTDLEIRAQGLPYTKNIVSRKDYTFTIECKEEVIFFILNNGIQVQMSKIGNNYTGTIKPSSGTLSICYQVKKRDKNYAVIISYSVKNRI